MESIADIVFHQAMARPGAGLILRAREHGLQLNDLVLLLVLREHVPNASEPSLFASVRELTAIVERVGMTKSQVETSLKRLVDGGHLVRQQRDKRNREVAITTLMPLAFHVLEAGEGRATTALPLALRGLLAGEPGELIAEVQEAWQDSRMPDPAAGRRFRGGGEGWARVEALLLARVDATTGVIEAAIDAAEARQQQRARGVYAIEASDGVVEVDAHALQHSAPAPCDVELAVEVLAIAEAARPGTITMRNAHVRLAEALYSRHIGFARGLDAGKAVKVIGRQMAKDTWSRPYSIRQAWYTSAAAAVQAHAAAGCSQVS